MISCSPPFKFPNDDDCDTTKFYKNGASAFLIFSREMRPQITHSCPNLKASDITSLLSELWKKLPEYEREKHREKARILAQSCEISPNDRKYLGHNFAQPKILLKKTEQQNLSFNNPKKKSLTRPIENVNCLIPSNDINAEIDPGTNKPCENLQKHELLPSIYEFIYPSPN